MMNTKTLLAMPVYNEQRYIASVIGEVRRYTQEILVIDDGSTDTTPTLLAQQPVDVVRHARNRGYGRSLKDAFRWAACYGYDWLITMDCDLQHEPASLPDFFRAIQQDDADVLSGSRYLTQAGDANTLLPPADRRSINATMTVEINQRLGLSITDAFCGYKAYRVSALKRLTLDEPGYAFPMQFWVQAVAKSFRVREIPVRLIYNDLNRTFGGILDNPDLRLKHYRHVLETEIAKFPELACGLLQPSPCPCR